MTFSGTRQNSIHASINGQNVIVNMVWRFQSSSMEKACHKHGFCIYSIWVGTLPFNNLSITEKTGIKSGCIGWMQPPYLKTQDVVRFNKKYSLFFLKNYWLSVATEIYFPAKVLSFLLPALRT